MEPPESSGATAPQNQLEHYSGHVSHYVSRTTQNGLEQYYSIIVLVSFHFVEGSGRIPEPPTAYNRHSPLLYLVFNKQAHSFFSSHSQGTAFRILLFAALIFAVTTSFTEALPL